ncbi:hypothetical protein BDW62DRAFT_172928 [Aspergillus aurantiobrunneus]
MCTVNVTTKIYECGDRVQKDVNFVPCRHYGTSQCPGVRENPMGSSMVKGKCGRYDCRNP